MSWPAKYSMYTSFFTCRHVTQFKTHSPHLKAVRRVHPPDALRQWSKLFFPCCSIPYLLLQSEDDMNECIPRMGDWLEFSTVLITVKGITILTELEIFLCSDVQKGYSTFSSSTCNNEIFETQRPDTCKDSANGESETEVTANTCVGTESYPKLRQQKLLTSQCDHIACQRRWWIAESQQPPRGG